MAFNGLRSKGTMFQIPGDKAYLYSIQSSAAIYAVNGHPFTPTLRYAGFAVIFSLFSFSSSTSQLHLRNKSILEIMSHYIGGINLPHHPTLEEFRILTCQPDGKVSRELN